MNKRSEDQERGKERLAYTMDEAATATGLGRTSIYMAIKRGDLQAKRCGRKLVIPAANLDSFLNNLPPAA